ncbi:hypothetical protein QYZ43_21175 [Vibrio parahaemolyticus]|nr:hypothetical protein [Vibrio parahaemolyticus]MDN4723417.1 hypothetical protein [Vibrio parahaemolyticus]MDN4727722.1 hypothetical protein [Vibrio parahaemolyticus]MDN4732388.1 hypothetical protein [Vibrio parahaemolyticus]
MTKQRIAHCHLLNTSLDPYALIASKSQRLSWNQTGDTEVLLSKKKLWNGLGCLERTRNKRCKLS